MNNDRRMVLCERLIPVIRYENDNWWHELNSYPEKKLFDVSGRIVPALESDVYDAVEEGRRRGYRPVILCRDTAEQLRVKDRLRQKCDPAKVLARGPNSGLMGYIIGHPSLEVIQGWIGMCWAYWPSADYKQALDDWIESDAMVSEMARRLQSNEVRFEDCLWISDNSEDEEKEYPRQLDFEWVLDPRHRIKICLEAPNVAQAQHECGDPGPVHLYLGELCVEIDANDQAPLNGEHLEIIADSLGIEV